MISRLKYNLYKIITKLISDGSERDRVLALENSAIFNKSVIIKPEAIIDNLANAKELIEIGGDSVIRGQLLIFPHDGAIQIGRDCFVGEGSRIWSSDSIVIGDRVLISHNVNIHDSNSHPVDMDLRHKHFKEIISVGYPEFASFDIQTKPIVINDDVWIGFNATILKGVTIGKGAIIAASSVVTKNIPDYTIVAGNPATVIRNIK